LTSSLLSFFQESSRKRKQGGPEVVDVISPKTTSSASSGKTAGISLLKKKVSAPAPAPSPVTSGVLTAPQIILPPPPPARPTVATSFPAGSKLPPEWGLGLVKINMTALGFSTIGPVTIHDLCKPRPNDPFPSDVGAGSMFGSGVPIPTTNDGDSEEAIIQKWTDYGDQVQAERFVIRNAVEDLLAGIMPFPFAFPSPIELGHFALKVSNNPSSSSCTAIAHWIESGRLEKRKGSCGPLGQLLSEASKSLERIRAKAKDKHRPVPSGAVGMFGPAGQNMNASIKLKEYRALYPDLIVTAEMCGMTGATGIAMNAAIENADLPLMQKVPSQYSGRSRNNLEEQQAQHRNLIAQGVLFSVDGKKRTPC